jgi:thiopurine S-methyltransferase
MKKEFWLEKWQNNQTGFHKNFTHPLLVEYIQKLNLSQGDSIFVPLCGKTVDMLWLNQQGFRVIGIELSQLAVEQFFTENELEFSKHQEGSFVVYRYENITLYQGDFFDMSKDQLKEVKAVYDRAALIALPDDLAGKYVDKMSEIIPSHAKELLITLEFIKKLGPLGPPFTTPDTKVLELFSNYQSVELLQEVDIISREAKFKELGCEYVYERVYLVNF